MDQQQQNEQTASALKQSSDADPDGATGSRSTSNPIGRSDGHGSISHPSPPNHNHGVTTTHSNGTHTAAMEQQRHSTNINGHLSAPTDGMGHVSPPVPAGSYTSSAAAAAMPSMPLHAALPDRKGVPHVYRDFSNVPDAVGVVRKKTGGVAQPFPEKLHNMLSIESEAHPQAVSWLPHGRAFIVRDPHEFTDYIMHR